MSDNVTGQEVTGEGEVNPTLEADELQQAVEAIVAGAVSTQLLEDLKVLAPNAAAIEETLRELLLPAVDVNSESEAVVAQLRNAAAVYGSESTAAFTEYEYKQLQEALLPHFENSVVKLSELERLFGDSVPEFLVESRQSSWWDPSVVEAALTDFRERLELQTVKDSQAAEEAVPSSKLGSFRFVEAPAAVQDNLSALLLDFKELEGDLSDRKSEDEETDEGEWGVAEIATGGELEHGEHSSVVVDSQSRSAETVLLIAEGILKHKLSKVLAHDLLEELSSLLQRVAGQEEWWRDKVIIADIADALAQLLTGEPWPQSGEGVWPRELSSSSKLSSSAPDESDYLLYLQKSAECYPLDLETVRDKKLKKASVAERFNILKNERGTRMLELEAHELEEIRAIIQEQCSADPTPPLVRDIATLYSDKAIREGRAWGFSRALALYTSGLVSELLTGTQSPEEKTAPLIRSYRTELMTEDEFIAHYNQSHWPSIGLATDLSIFTLKDGELHVLLIRRGNHPEKGKLALPGGFVDPTESIDEAAARELAEETAVGLPESYFLEQVKTYGYPGRDRRGYIASVLYAALLPEAPEPEAGDDAAEAEFYPVTEVLADYELAYDHKELLRDALERVRAKLEYSPIVFDFLPKRGFTMTELREVYEAVWGFELLPSDFNRRLSQVPHALEPVKNSQGGSPLWTRGAAEYFSPPLDRKQMKQASELSWSEE